MKSRLRQPTISPLTFGVLAMCHAVLCIGLSPTWGLDKDTGPLPASTKKASPKSNYLALEDAEALARQLCKIPITGCRVEDLTYEGLLRVLNRNLKAAGRLERVYWDLPAHEACNPDSIERDIKIGDPWGPYAKVTGKLDRKKLVEEINRGSVYDLINNITLWICNVTGCFKDGIQIQGGENWPHLKDRMGLYPMTFK